MAASLRVDACDLGNRLPFASTAGAGSHVCFICLERRSSMSWFMMW